MLRPMACDTDPTPAPIPLTPYRACGLVEGFIECDTDDPDHEVQDAWQYLIDTGLAWQLQGWYGRTASALIEQGVCTAPTGRDRG